MISEEYRAKRKLILVQDENRHLERTIKEKDNALLMIEQLKEKLERMEKFADPCYLKT